MSRNGNRDRASPAYPVPTIVSRRSRRRLRLQDPAYVADTAHDFWWAIQRRERFKSTRSAAELEAWIREAPELREILAREALDRARYDDGGRLLAKVVLEHYARHPQDVKVSEVVRREIDKAHPQLVAQLSTAQWVWALAAAGRVYDAHQET